MNKLAVVFFLLSGVTIASDKPLTFIGFENFLSDAHTQDFTRCFICQKNNPDIHLISRFKPDAHKKCYDPILEIEPAYARAMNELLNKDNSTNEYNHDAYRRALIRLVLYKVSTVKNCDSFESYIKLFGKPKLEKIFFNGVLSATGQKPFNAITDWSVQQLAPDRIIPECNENIMKELDFWSYLLSLISK